MATGVHLDEVLRRQGLRDGHCECNSVVLLHVLLLQQEELMMQHILAVTILHNDPEGLHKPMQCVLQHVTQLSCCASQTLFMANRCGRVPYTHAVCREYFMQCYQLPYIPSTLG